MSYYTDVLVGKLVIDAELCYGNRDLSIELECFFGCENHIHPFCTVDVGEVKLPLAIQRDTRWHCVLPVAAQVNSKAANNARRLHVDCKRTAPGDVGRVIVRIRGGEPLPNLLPIVNTLQLGRGVFDLVDRVAMFEKVGRIVGSICADALAALHSFIII